MVSQNLLEVENLVVSFGRPGRQVSVVKDVSFSIGRGKTVALVGESGSGKTVTSLSIIGLVGKSSTGLTTSGAIRFALPNAKVTDILQLDRTGTRTLQGNEIAMIFQEPMTSLNPVLRVGEQIAEVLTRHKNLKWREAWAEAEHLLNKVGIPDAKRRARAYPHELSGGMRQRVMIAMALSCNPSLLIADEPTTALDATIQAQILDLIAEMKGEYGSSVLFITHDLGVVREIADSIIVMYAGRTVEEGPTAELLRNPLHPYTRGLIDCVPRMQTGDEPLHELRPIPGDVASPANTPSGCSFHPRCEFKVEGLCTDSVPELVDSGEGRRVRCARWKEIGGHPN